MRNVAQVFVNRDIMGVAKTHEYRAILRIAPVAPIYRVSWQTQHGLGRRALSLLGVCQMYSSFTPTNEQGVIVAFAAQAQEAGWEFVSIGASFPDAVLRKNGEEWRVEFEFKASNFLDHKHDHRECDLVICWENDYEDNPIPTLALSDPSWAVVEPSRATVEIVAIEYWKRRALRAEGQYKLARNAVVAPSFKLTDKRVDNKRSVNEERDERIEKLRSMAASNKQWPAAQAVAQMFGVSLRTAYNDLDAARKGTEPEQSTVNGAM